MNYQIVVPASASVNEELIAYELKEALVQKGLSVSVVSDTKAPTAKEIRIGATNRSPAMPKNHAYLISEANGCIQIAANSAYGYEEALHAFLLHAADGNASSGLKWSGDASRSFAGSMSSLNQKYGNLRAMFYNVYGWNDAGPVDLRQKQQIELLRWYRPDVLGLQEYSPVYQSEFTPMIQQLGYARVTVKNDPTAYTPLFYRTDTLELVDCGSVLYPETMKLDGVTVNSNDVKSKSLTWAVLRLKENGKCFIAISTHFMWSASNLTSAQANAIRVANAQAVLDEIQTIYSKNTAYNGLPVVMGGDFNCYPDSDPVRTLKSGGMQWAYDIAGEKSQCGGTKPYPVYDADKHIYTENISAPTDRYDRAIDYIMLAQGKTGAPQINVSTYYTVTDRYACQSSDHCPKLADITLN